MPRTIFDKLLRFKYKQNILSKAKLMKGTYIYVHDDYWKDTLEYEKELLEEVELWLG